MFAPVIPCFEYLHVIIPSHSFWAHQHKGPVELIMRHHNRDKTAIPIKPTETVFFIRPLFLGPLLLLTFLCTLYFLVFVLFPFLFLYRGRLVLRSRLWPFLACGPFSPYFPSLGLDCFFLSCVFKSHRPRYIQEVNLIDYSKQYIEIWKIRRKDVNRIGCVGNELV